MSAAAVTGARPTPPHGRARRPRSPSSTSARTRSARRLRAAVPGADRAVQREVGLRTRARASPRPAGWVGRRSTARCMRCAASRISPVRCGPTRSSMSPPRRCGGPRTAASSWPRPREATGRAVTVLSGHDEAHAAAMGVAYSFHQPDGRGRRSGRRQRRPVHGDAGRPGAALRQPAHRHPADHPNAARGPGRRGGLVDERLASLPWLDGAARRSTASTSSAVAGEPWRASGWP